MTVLEAPSAPVRNDHARFRKLLERAKAHPPVPTAVAHPCDQSSLESVVEAAKLKLIEPILVGPEARIREVATENDLDISGFEIVDAAYSQDAAAKAVALVREGRAEALMKGSLHTDEIMARGGRSRHRPPDFAADQPLLHHGRSGSRRRRSSSPTRRSTSRRR